MDSQLYEWVNGLADSTPWAHWAFAAFAKYGIGLFAVLLIVAFVDARRRADLRGVATAIWAGGSALVALAIGAVIAGIVDRPRPFDVIAGAHVLIARSSDVTFPSDHATAVGAVAAGLLLGRHRRTGVVAVLAALLMAFARVYVGVHYPSDVAAGLALGAVVAWLGGLVVVPLLTRGLSRVARSRFRRIVTADAADAADAATTRSSTATGSSSADTIRRGRRLPLEAAGTVWTWWRSRTPQQRQLLALAASLAAFLGLAIAVMANTPLTQVDGQVDGAIDRYNRGDHDAAHLARVVSFVGAAPFLAVVVLTVVVALVANRRWRDGVFLVLTAGSGAIVAQTAKDVVARNRPVVVHAVAHETGYSFPSSHVLNATVVYGALLVVVWPLIGRRLTRLAAVLAVAGVVAGIAASRVILTVHYPSDVVAGIAASRVILTVHYPSDVVAGVLAGVAILLVASLVRSDSLTTADLHAAHPVEERSEPPTLAAVSA